MLFRLLLDDGDVASRYMSDGSTATSGPTMLSILFGRITLFRRCCRVDCTDGLVLVSLMLLVLLRVLLSAARVRVIVV